MVTVPRQKGRRNFQRLDSLVSKAGTTQWLAACQLTAKYAYSAKFLAYLKPGEKAPWLLATPKTVR
jgi:hypothetical protein